MAYLLYFAENNVNISEGDVFPIDHTAVFTEFGPVLAMHLLAGSTSVTMDGKASKGLFQSGDLHRCGRAHTSITGPIRLRRKPFGCSVFGVFTVWP